MEVDGKFDTLIDFMYFPGTRLSQTTPNHTKPHHTKLHQTKLHQTKPHQTTPNQTKPSNGPFVCKKSVSQNMHLRWHYMFHSSDTHRIPWFPDSIRNMFGKSYRVPGKYMKTKRHQSNIKLLIHLQDEKNAYTLLYHFVQNRTT